MLVNVFYYMHHPHHPSMGMLNPTGGGGTWGAVCGVGSWGPPKLILPDGEIWASEPRLVLTLAWFCGLWRFLVLVTMASFLALGPGVVFGAGAEACG